MNRTSYFIPQLTKRKKIHSECQKAGMGNEYKKIKEYFKYKNIWSKKELKEIEEKVNEFKCNHPSYKNYIDQKEKSNFEVSDHGQYRMSSYHTEPKIFDVSVYMLELLGFKKITDNVNVDLDIKEDVQWPNKESERCYQWWAHPDGILTRLTSYRKDSLNNFLYNSMDTYIKINVGIGRPARVYSINSSNNCSSSYDLEENGGLTLTLSHTSSTSPFQLLGVLGESQKIGNFLPFDQWKKNGYLFSLHLEDWVSFKDKKSSIYQSNEQLKDTENKKKEKLASKIVQEFINSFELKLNKIEEDSGICGIKQLFKQSELYTSVIKRPNEKKNFTEDAIKKQSNGFLKTWDKRKNNGRKNPILIKGGIFEERVCSSSLDLLDKVDSFEIKRYRSEKDKYIITTWLRDVLSNTQVNLAINDDNLHGIKEIKKHKKVIQWDKVNAFEALENGMSLPMFLLEACLSGNMLSYNHLKDILKEAPRDIIETWCKKPDISGKTVPMRLMENMSFNHHGNVLNQLTSEQKEIRNNFLKDNGFETMKTEKQKNDFHNFLERHSFTKGEELLDILSNRMKPKEWVMNTEKQSSNGIWFYNYQRKLLRYLMNRNLIPFEEYKKVKQKFKNIGCNLSDKWVWSEPFSLEKSDDVEKYYAYMIELPQRLGGDTLKESISDLPKEFKDKPEYMQAIYEDLVLSDSIKNKKEDSIKRRSKM